MFMLLRSRWFWAAAFGLLAVRCSPAWAQTGPASPTTKTGSWPPIPTPLYFVDTQPADSAVLASLNPNDIATLYVVKGAAARALNAKAAGRGLIAITTKRNEKNAEVAAFSQQVEQALKAHQSPSTATIRAENAYQPADVRYYLNGRVSNRVEINTLDSHTVMGVRTLHGKRATDYTHNAEVTEVFLITTQN